jgi:hypothetical protein
LKTTNWKDIAELIGIAAIVASLLFVGMQMRQDQEIAIVETRGDATAAMIGLTDSLKGKENIWRKGLDGAPLTDAEQIQFLALAKVVDSQFFTLWIRWSRIGPVNPNAAAMQYAYALYSHPGLRLARGIDLDYSRMRAEAFGVPSARSDFVDSVDEFLAKLDSEKPPISDDKYYVFW